MRRPVSRCHPPRLAADPSGYCRYCLQAGDVQALRDLISRPIYVIGHTAHGSRELPDRCPKCAAIGDSDGDTFHCIMCGTYWERTVGSILPPRRTPGPKGVLA